MPDGAPDVILAHPPSRLSALLPDAVVAVESGGNLRGAALRPAESEALGRVSPGREREFTQARYCARLALAALGAGGCAIGIGEGRRPLWPAAVVGSITHCRGYCAAAVAPRARFASIGIDAEPHDELPRGVLTMIARPEEQRRLAELSTAGLCWDRLLFSAKESVYKTWYPLMERWLGFSDASIRFLPDPVQPRAGAFEASLLAGPLLVDGAEITRLDGRYRVVDRHVLTGIALPASHA